MHNFIFLKILFVVVTPYLDQDSPKVLALQLVVDIYFYLFYFPFNL